MKKIAVYTGFMTDAYRERINETAAAAEIGRASCRERV